jgi:hypothetical protein
MEHTWDTSQNVGRIVPTFLQFVTPLDTWQGMQIHVGRMSPMNKPAFGTLFSDTYFFYVPLASIWREDMITSSYNFMDVISGKQTGYSWPTASVTYAKGDDTYGIESYLGVGFKGAAQSNFTINKLPRMAYNHIYNKMFLDERNQTEVTIDSSDGLRRANFKGKGYYQLLMSDVEQGATVTVDTSGASVNVNTIKDAFNEQKYAELKERYGEEYEDILRLHGVNPSSLAREEVQLVAKGSTQVGISEVQVTATSASENSGEYVGHGIVINRTKMQPRLFLDYGILMGVNVLRPRLTLKNTIPPWADMTDHEDYYHAAYANRSHRNVPGHRISSIASDANRNATYAYEPYYNWLRSAPDVVAGVYNDVDTYDDQIMVRELGANAGAIESHANLMQVNDSDFEYLLQDTTQPDMFTHCINRIGKRSIVAKESGHVK